MPKHKRGITGDRERRRRRQLQRERRQDKDAEVLRRANEATRLRAARSRESEETVNVRRKENAQRQRAFRMEETEEAANVRRMENAQRQRAFRMEETEEAANVRRLENAQRQHTIRMQETNKDANMRKNVDAQRHRQVRTQETIEVHEERLRTNRIQRTQVALHNIARSPITEDIVQHTCGYMDNYCYHCAGLFFQDEKNSRGKYVPCCHNGNIVEPERDYPQELQDLFTGNHAFSSEFFDKIRNYNSAMSFASMGANIDLPIGSGPYCFRIHGAIYHKTSNFHPEQSGQEKYAQLYILDSDQALTQRLNMIQNVTLNANLLTLLDSILRKENPYAKAYKMLKEFEEDVLREQGAGSTVDIRMYIKGGNRIGEHKGRYNAPKENEVAAIFKSIDGVPPSNRDIVIHARGTGLIRISTLNPNLEPMTYVLFFPRGDKGFEVGQKYSELQFYSHRISVRRNCFNAVLYGQKLFQQYLVDAYVKVEGNRLSFLRNHQNQLRVDTYMGLSDHIYRVAEETGAKPGIPVILPSTFIGSPRCMHQNYQDSMAIVRDYGKPDLFLTFTCNPKWPEITENLFPGQRAHDRPDIVSRVFDIKKKALLKDLIQNQVLGKTVANIHVIEFQKRGLPHMHLLLILEQDDKIRNSDCIDTLVCAEIPDADVDHVLYNIVSSSMIHGPCGELNRNSPCMIDGVCSKGYPKSFQEETKENVGGYPLYRRRNNGNFIMLRNNIIDNRWVVPYNPYLSKKYGAHINLEVCSSIKSVKYLFKYVYKGHDTANVVLEQSGNKTLMWDEIKMFLNARYVSAPEAIWRLFEKKMHSNSHSIIRLPVHLEFLQPVYFMDSNAKDALQRATSRYTMLTAWFELNRTLAEANRYLYPEIPKHFTWKDYTWNRRTKLGDKIISRMFSVSPKDTERFHLRMLLCHVKGAKSFQDLRTYENVEYATFKEACQARNLLQDDQEWRNCLREASIFQMPSQLRQMFSFICIFCNCTDPIALWDEFKEFLCEDFSRSYSLDDSFSLALRSIQEHLKVHNVSLSSLHLPEPKDNIDNAPRVPLYDMQFEMQQAEQTKSKLNPEQRVVYDAVLEAAQDMNKNCPKTFCVNAFAGTGKTFLFKSILHAVRGMGHVAVPVAWTGIAAVLLCGGKTAHSTFKLPIPILENSSCRIKHDSPEGINLKATKLFIWDECTMTPNHALEAVDRLLRDLTGVNVPFGGKVVLLGGDWRQTLPVVLHGNRTSKIENCLKNSSLWPYFRQFELNKNMRLQPEEQEFSEWLLKLGDGNLQNESDLEEDIIEIPSQCVVNGSIVDEIFGSDNFDFQDFTSKVILCPKNDETLKLNEEILSRFPGQTFTFYSADTIISDDPEEQDTFQLDFVHSLTPSGMPPHCLNLKLGVIVMLLRNLNPSNGLCNGTRLIIKRIMRNFLDCEVITGQNAGSRVFIPRIQLSPSDSNLPFELTRRQFPVRLSFAMTISKSQGQTLKKVGIFLPQPVFSHGMLYVAFSRCTSLNSIRVLVSNTKKQGHLLRNSNKVFTQNVVYREVLQ